MRVRSCRAGVRQYSGVKAIGSLHPPLESQSGCTMGAYAVCSGAQYRQDPRVWGADLSPDRAKKNEKLPSARETRLSVEPWTGKTLCKIGFSTVSLAGICSFERL